MSQENVEIVRSVYEAWNAKDMTALRELYHPDVVIHHVEGWPEPGPSVGREAVFRDSSSFAMPGGATPWSRSQTSSRAPTAWS